MPKFEKRNKWFSTIWFVEFPGLLTCTVTKYRSVFRFQMISPELEGERKKGVLELADGLRMMANQAAKSCDKSYQKRGQDTDPDEGESYFKLPVFPKDPMRYEIFVTRDDATGFVLADVPLMEFYELPDVMQAAHVLGQCAELMREYERVAALEKKG